MKKNRKIINEKTLLYAIIALMLVILSVVIFYIVRNPQINWKDFIPDLRYCIIWLFIFAYCWAHGKGLSENLYARDAKNNEIIYDKSKTKSEKEKQLKFYSRASIIAESLRSQSAIVIMAIIAMLELTSDQNNVTYVWNFLISIILLVIITIYTFCFCNKFKCIIPKDNDNFRKAKIDELLKNS